MFLDNKHGVTAHEVLLRSPLTSATVYPQQVVVRALHHNAAAIICAHNHHSGDPEPSNANRAITKRLTDALKLIEVRVLDHLVVTLAEHDYL